jgi:multidrug efflux pump subunit AcrB
MELTINRLMPGPTDQPIEIRLLSDDFKQLERVSEQLQAKLRTFLGVTGVHQDVTPGKRELRVTLRAAARTLGLTLDDVATQVRQGYYGGEAVQLQRGRDQVKVRVRFPEEERQTIADLENMRISTPAGYEVPFLEVADVQWGRSYGRIMHQGGKRRVRVIAELDERHANAEQIVNNLESGMLRDLVNQGSHTSSAATGNRLPNRSTASSKDP